MTEGQKEKLRELLPIHGADVVEPGEPTRTPCNRNYIQSLIDGECRDKPFTTTACKMAVDEVLGIKQKFDMVMR